jgi:hypothetical protein
VTGSRAVKEFRSHRYHLPNDDLDQPIHWPAAAQLAHVNYRIALAIGNDPARPAWKPGNFFGEKFGTGLTR